MLKISFWFSACRTCFWKVLDFFSLFALLKLHKERRIEEIVVYKSVQEEKMKAIFHISYMLNWTTCLQKLFNFWSLFCYTGSEGKGGPNFSFCRGIICQLSHWFLSFVTEGLDHLFWFPYHKENHVSTCLTCGKYLYETHPLVFLLPNILHWSIQ